MILQYSIVFHNVVYHLTTLIDNRNFVENFHVILSLSNSDAR